MVKMSRSALALFGAAAVAVSLVGCAQDVGDINRVQPNYSKKADFDGVWFMRHTIIDVPPTMRGIFVGVSSEMEKIRWEIQEDVLIAYRAYELIPGYDPNAGDKVGGGGRQPHTPYAPGHGEGRDPEGYKEAPIAMYPIISHFDIQRQYNTATGEESNLIVENSSDRPWYERDYMRVDWSRNLLPVTFPAYVSSLANSSIFVQANEGGLDAFREEREGDRLGYFDFVTKIALNDQEIKIRQSFERQADDEPRDYEPVFYDDKMMTKFGYFRTERLVYDRRYGFRDDKQIFLANRHDIWLNDYQRGANGKMLTDKDGRLLPTPMADRIPKPVVYYLSENYPKEVEPGAFRMAADWDRAFTRAAAAAKGITPAELKAKYGPMFILCHNPVTEADPAACDPRPADKRDGAYRALVGDLRKSFVYWVDAPQASGPLGYGPSYPDPETGEIVSGTAYVYGAAVDTYAQSALDIVKFVNGDVSEEELRDGEDVLKYLRENYDKSIDPRGRAQGELDPNLSGMDMLDAKERLLAPRQRELFNLVKRDGLEQLQARAGFMDRQVEKMKAGGFDRLLLDDEVVRGLSNGKIDPAQMKDADVTELLAKNNPLDHLRNVQKGKVDRRAKTDLELRHATCFHEAEMDVAVVGTALKYKGRKDYDVIWNELRNDIFQGVMAHEVGHTIGLRHNFQGSYDSVNYFDKYWELRAENFRSPGSVADLYEVNKLTDAQRDGDMTRYQYSSIMDYHSRFNSDFAGIGKYDEAAVLFAYTTGTYKGLTPADSAQKSQEMGYVEVFKDIDPAAQLVLPGYQPFPLIEYLHGFDDRFAPSQHPLEDLHYTTLVMAMGGPSKLKNRELMRFSQLQKIREEKEVGDVTRPIEVPYMFCSDEWVQAAVSCNLWDLGSDPFELVQWAVRRYNDYYPFTHFRRNRLTFSSISGAAAANRSFAMMPFVYQQWFFDRYYSIDATLSNYYTLGAFAGLNFLSEVVTMPSYGAYTLDANTNTYRLVSYNPEVQGNRNTSIDLRVYPGQGRRQFSRYASQSGYYYFYRVAEAGHFWDYLYALVSLTASEAVALGVDLQADFRSYSLPYYLLFESEVTSLFNGLFREDYRAIAPGVDDKGRLMRRPLAALATNNTAFDPLTGATVPRMDANAPRVDLNTNFTQRIYAMLYGLAYLKSSYSQNFVDQARVYKLGNGRAIEPGNGFEQISFTNPITGIAYGAIRPVGETEGLGVGAQMVLRGAELEAIVRNTSLPNNRRQAALNELVGLVEDIAMVGEMIELLGGAF
jgi:hypothetical protein